MRTMSTPGPAPTHPPRPSLPRRVGDVAGTVIAIGSCVLWALLDATFDVARFDDADTGAVWWLVYLLVGLGVATALVWRRSHPMAVCVGTAIAVIAVPVGFFAPWWTLVWVFITRRWRDVAIATTATAAAIAATLWQDYARGADAMLALTDEAGTTTQLALAGYVGLGVLSLGVAIAVGLVRRYRTSARAARQAEQISTRTAEELRTELSRQEERDLIAREMHDTVAHHLSLVSLHASALEVTAADPGTDVPEAARSMRTSAHKALEEMRTLIANLREPSDGGLGLAGSERGLEELPALVEDARRAGAVIAPTIYISGAENAPVTLTRAVYRIVQESLTNALKHAPGVPVLLDVRAAPGHGVQITVTNPLPVRSMTSPGPGGGGPGEPHHHDRTGLPGHDGTGPPRHDGTGLPHSGGAGQRGMAERAHALGGTLRAGPDGEAYVVQAQLPWPAPAPAS